MEARLCHRRHGMTKGWDTVEYDQIVTLEDFGDGVQRRVVARPDYDPECPLLWTGAAVVGYGFGWHNRERTFGDEWLSGELRDGARGLSDVLGSEREVLEALQKHYVRAGHNCEIRSWVGYNQGDYMTYLIVGAKRDCEAYGTYGEVFEMWLSGDVYVAELQELVTWTSEDGDVSSEWDVSGDSVCGIYADNEREFEKVAHYYFCEAPGCAMVHDDAKVEA